jgi:hypothetical protein
VFFDITTVYFIARDETKAKAITDLFACCIINQNGSQCPVGSSVSPDLCQCFRMKRFAPALANSEKLNFLETTLKSKAHSHYLPGNSWLINHNHFRKHPEHFTSKLLEFHAYLANRNFVKSCCYSDLPQDFDRIISMDYQVYPFSDYEATVLGILWKSLGKRYEYISLTQEVSEESIRGLFTPTLSLRTRQILISYCLHSRDWNQPKFVQTSLNQTIAKKLLNQCRSPQHELSETVKIPFWYAENLHTSPSYLNTFPTPSQISARTFSKAVDRYLAEKGIEVPLKRAVQKEPIVAILQRPDGAGVRKFVNLDDLCRLVRTELKTRKVEQWFIDGNMTALEQIAYFRSFDVLISAHSPQLTNLIFARNTSHVIEFQPENAQEYTFMKKGQAIGLDYYLLTKGHRFKNHGYDKKDWRSWDYEVNLDEVRLALQSILRKRAEIGH